MSEGARVLITGIAGELAGMVARALEARDDVHELVGVDVREPRHDLRRTEFVRADLRNPLVARVLDVAAIDTVVHLSTASNATEGGGRVRMKERNVIGAMQLFAACQRTTMRRVVLRSTTAVYGSDHRDPAMFREDATARRPATEGYGRDVIEIEGYARELGRRRRDLDVSVLRFANLIGGRVDGAFQSLFALPVVPSVLGFDPRLQFVHEDDATAILVEAATEPRPGTFNVAGDGAVYLSQCVRLAGRVSVPVPPPFVSGVAALVRRSRRGDVSPEQLRFLRFGRGVDTSLLRECFVTQPAYTSRGAFEDFLRRRRGAGLDDRRRPGHLERGLDALVHPREGRRVADAPRGVGR